MQEFAEAVLSLSELLPNFAAFYRDQNFPYFMQRHFANAQHACAYARDYLCGLSRGGITHVKAVSAAQRFPFGLLWTFYRHNERVTPRCEIKRIICKTEGGGADMLIYGGRHGITSGLQIIFPCAASDRLHVLALHHDRYFYACHARHVHFRYVINKLFWRDLGFSAETSNTV